MLQPKRALSQAIRRELDAINNSSVIVATVLTVVNDELASFEALGLSIANGRIVTSKPTPPPRSCGTYAARNLDGWVQKRKDLPMEPREISHWAPDWHGSGFHLVSRTINAWPVEHHPAKMLTISSTVLEPLVDGAIVRFRVDQPLSRDDSRFAEKLQFNLRLLREAAGEAQIFDADLSDDDFATIQ